jgi:hypothetical protein
LTTERVDSGETEPPAADSRHWWSELSLETGTGAKVSLGSLTLFVFRLEGEWHLGYERAPKSEFEPEGWTSEPLSELPVRPPNLARFACGECGRRVRLVPRVPDRSLVARPSVPLHVLPGERSTIYVSFPVWVDVTVGSQRLTLAEVPVIRLSDTWFGSSTRHGELAYALKTQARVRLDEVPRRPYRALTPVVIRNQGADILEIDRMNLPVPYLSIYAARGASLWTETVTMLRRESEELAQLEVGRGPADEAAGGELLSEPRMRARESLLVRAFGSILSPLSRGAFE